jgi:transcriptional regulator with XRE-family HTH domain
MKHFKEIAVIKKTYMANDSLREAREKKKIGLREFSRIINMSPSTISSIEKGLHTTPLKTAEMIEKELSKL